MRKYTHLPFPNCQILKGPYSIHVNITGESQYVHFPPLPTKPKRRGAPIGIPSPVFSIRLVSPSYPNPSPLPDPRSKDRDRRLLLFNIHPPQSRFFITDFQYAELTIMMIKKTSFSSLLDVIAFLMIAACSFRDEQVFRSSSLLGRVVKDATIYFLVIVWAHLTLIIYVGRMGDVSGSRPRMTLVPDSLFAWVAVSRGFSSCSQRCESTPRAPHSNSSSLSCQNVIAQTRTSLARKKILLIPDKKTNYV